MAYIALALFSLAALGLQKLELYLQGGAPRS